MAGINPTFNEITLNGLNTPIKMQVLAEWVKNMVPPYVVYKDTV